MAFAVLGRHPREPAGQDRGPPGVGDGERPEHAHPVGQPPVGDHRSAPHREHLLGAPGPRLRLDPPPQRLPLAGAELTGEDPGEPARRGDRRDEQIGQVVMDEPAVPGVPAPPRPRRRQAELLAQHRPADGREESRQGGVLQHCRPDRVDHGHDAPPGGLDEAGDARSGAGEQVERVGAIGVDAPDDDVDRLGPLGGEQPHSAPAHGEVLAGDDRETEQGGGEHLVERRFARLGRREHDDPGELRGAGPELLQSGAHRVEEPPQAAQVRLAVHRGERPGGDPTDRHGVPGPDGRLGSVPDDTPPPEVVHAEVGCGEEEAMPGRNPVGLGEEAGMAEDEFGGEQAAGDEGALPVEVGEHQVEKGRALGQSPLEAGPLVGADDQGQRVDGEMLRPAVDLRPHDDDVVLDQPPGDLAPALEIGQRQPSQVRRAGRPGAGRRSGRRIVSHRDQSTGVPDAFRRRVAVTGPGGSLAATRS